MSNMKSFAEARNACVGGIGLLVICLTNLAVGAEIKVCDKGEGCDYLSGAAIKLPAAMLGTNLFGVGARIIDNRRHSAQPAAFDSSGSLSCAESAIPCVFPSYLEGNPYLSFLQEVRRYTNYCCTVTVDCPVTFYLLVDNRVNDFTELSSLDDPKFGPPDTELIPQDGWKRVNTGISPLVGGTNRADYISIFEGGVGVGAVNQFYAIYSKTLPQGGSVTLRTQFEGNMYCLVIATNKVAASAKNPVPKPPPPHAGG